MCASGILTPVAYDSMWTDRHGTAQLSPCHVVTNGSFWLLLRRVSRATQALVTNSRILPQPAASIMLFTIDYLLNTLCSMGY